MSQRFPSLPSLLAAALLAVALDAQAAPEVAIRAPLSTDNYRLLAVAVGATAGWLVAGAVADVLLLSPLLASPRSDPLRPLLQVWGAVFGGVLMDLRYGDR